MRYKKSTRISTRKWSGLHGALLEDIGYHRGEWLRTKYPKVHKVKKINQQVDKPIYERRYLRRSVKFIIYFYLITTVIFSIARGLITGYWGL